MTVDLAAIRRAPRLTEELVGGTLTIDDFAGGTTQARFEKMVEAYQHEISLGATSRGRLRRYLAMAVLPGQDIVFESAVTISRMMGGMLLGPGPWDSDTAGHDAYAQRGVIRASPGFSDTALLKLVDCNGLEISGVNFSGASNASRTAIGIGTQSTAGAGTCNLQLARCRFRYFTKAMSMGAFTVSPSLDSDCVWRECGFVNCNTGVEFCHGQSLVHYLERCAFNSVDVGVLITNGGYVRMVHSHTYDTQVLVRVVQIASNGGEVHIDGLRMDGTTYRTQILDIQNTQLGYGFYQISGAKRISGQPTSTTPAVQARSRSYVVLDRCDLGAPGSGSNNKWVAVGAGSDNVDPGLVEVTHCDLGITSNASEICGTVTDDLGVVRFSSNAKSTTGGFVYLVDSIYAPSNG